MEKLGEGRTAEVYAYAEGKVVKLYRPGFEGDAAWELSIMEKLSGLDLPVPAVYGEVLIDGRRGILMERCDGRSMLALLQDNPMAIRRMAKLLASLQHALAGQPARELPSLKEALAWQIERVDALAEDDRQRVLAYLEALPDEDRLCHFDFHPDNILIDGGKAFIIDWVNARRGAPLADVCRTSLLLQTGAMPPGLPAHLTEPMRRFAESLHRQYLAEYLRLSGETADAQAALERWMLPVMAARLYEGIAEERVFLMQGIAERLAAL